MTKATHTSGPWRQGTKYPGRIMTDTRLVASVCRFREDEDAPDETEQANARLIAAAPDLLEACKQILDSELVTSGVFSHCRGCGAIYGHGHAAACPVGRIEAAVARAEGKPRPNIDIELADTDLNPS